LEGAGVDDACAEDSTTTKGAAIPLTDTFHEYGDSGAYVGQDNFDYEAEARRDTSHCSESWKPKAPTVDVLLAADVIYDIKAHAALLHCIAAAAAKVVVIGYKPRHGASEDWILDRGIPGLGYRLDGRWMIRDDPAFVGFMKGPQALPDALELGVAVYSKTGPTPAATGHGRGGSEAKVSIATPGSGSAAQCDAPIQV